MKITERSKSEMRPLNRSICSKSSKKYAMMTKKRSNSLCKVGLMLLRIKMRMKPVSLAIHLLITIHRPEKRRFQTEIEARKASRLLKGKRKSSMISRAESLRPCLTRFTSLRSFIIKSSICHPFTASSMTKTFTTSSIPSL
jgi:hypothetical protein